MAKIDLTKYGITGTTEVIYNPSYDELFREETKPGLTGYDKGVVTDMGAVNVMTGVYTGRSPKDKFFVMDDTTRDTIWWTSDEYKNDNKPVTEKTWKALKELAGKEATFKCKIHEVKQTILPELDDEFAKDVSEFDTLAALRKDIKAKKLKTLQENADRAFENAAVELAGKNMTCDIPACMIDEQLDKHLEQFGYQLQAQGMKLEDYAKMMGGDLNGMRAAMRPMAEQTVRSNILLSEIVHQENIGLHRKHARDAQTLLLTARERQTILVELIGYLFPEVGALERFFHDVIEVAFASHAL